jgi:hypothetical protein
MGMRFCSRRAWLSQTALITYVRGHVFYMTEGLERNAGNGFDTRQQADAQTIALLLLSPSNIRGRQRFGA